MIAALPRSVSLPILDVLRGADEAPARQAFDRLWERARPVVERSLARQGLLGDEAGDVMQEAALRLWRGRLSVRAVSSGEWIVLALRTARRLALNALERTRAHGPLPDEDSLPIREALFVEALLGEDDRRVAWEAADRIWLGVPAGMDAGQCATAVLALRLVLAGGVGAAAVARMSGHGTSDVDRWMDDPALVSRAAFAALCPSGADLAARVLRPESPLSQEDLEAALAGKLTVEGWSAAEARAVCLREVHGMDLAAVARLVPSLTAPEVANALARAVDRYPLRERASAIKEALGPRPLPGSSLWKRVALEHAAQGLGRSHMLQRAEPPAREMGVALTLGTLDNWLDHGRLLARLATEVRREG